MEASSEERWVALLERTARPAIARGGPCLPGGAGAPFALAVNGALGRAPDPLPEGDAGLWWSLVDAQARECVAALVNLDAFGPLLAQDQFLAIEVWTESELCALHALFNLGIDHHNEAWLKRAERARDWHMEHTQPDNATGRPWAIHGFIRAGTPEAQHYAETLLHNCMAISGEPDVTSAWILLDAAKRITTSQQVNKSTHQPTDDASGVGGSGC